MPGVRLKGLHRVRMRLGAGAVVTYHYAWRGGPRLTAEPGTPEFLAQFAEAHRARTAPKGDDLSALVARYRASPEFQRLAESTRAEWGRWLARIETADIGKLPRRALEDPAVRGELLEWRDRWAARPRAADYALQVLARVLSWAKGRGLIAVNPAAGVERLHSADRADRVWTEADLEAFAVEASPQLARALRLACATGLRRGDLVALTWGDVGDTAIVVATRKSGQLATVPIVAEAAAVLAEIGRPRGEAAAAAPVLTNTFNAAWTEDGLTASLIKARDRAGLTLRLHDARGSFATRLRAAGLTRDEIAGVMGWDPARVERILARYVDQDAIVRSIAERLNRR